jgi:ribulose-phosphate 3-epimerase
LDEIGSDAELEVDGGINLETATRVVNAGATVLVAGSAVFNQHASVSKNIHMLRSAFQ